MIPRLFNYLQWTKATAVICRLKFQLIRKAAIYALSLVRSLLNTVYIIRLVNIILKEKVDLVHVNNGMSNLEPVIAAILLRRKYVVHFHGVEAPGFVQRMLLNRVHKYIVISRCLQDALSKNGFPRERMVVVPNPVQEVHALSDECMNMRSEYGLSPEDKVFGIVGRIVRWKGHIKFLKSAFDVLDEIPGAKALIVGDFSDGDADYQQQIIKIVEESGFKDRVFMTGYVKEVGKIYSIMDVCVHTSIEPEPFGLVIIEAMANGVPVIASDLGAPKEIITDNVNGYIINPESSK